jgi:hypothetical protein
LTPFPNKIPSKRSCWGTASLGAADPVEVDMNSKEAAPVTQQPPGSTEPGIPDLGRIGEQVSAVWDDYGYPLVAGVGVLVVVVVVTAVVKVARSRQRDRAVGGLTAVVVLAWTSEGLWEVARFTLGLPLGFAVMTFFVYEAMMLTCALQAERHRKRHPSPGPAGRYVWVLASITATVVALNAETLVEALLRFTLPLAAAGLWWVGITAERDDDPGEVKQLRAAERARREAIWAISWRRLLVAVGVMRPGAQTLTEAERERRIRQMVTAAASACSSCCPSWRAWSRRFDGATASSPPPPPVYLRYGSAVAPVETSRCGRSRGAIVTGPRPPHSAVHGSRRPAMRR